MSIAHRQERRFPRAAALAFAAALVAALVVPQLARADDASPPATDAGGDLWAVANSGGKQAIAASLPHVTIPPVEPKSSVPWTPVTVDSQPVPSSAEPVSETTPEPAPVPETSGGAVPHEASQPAESGAVAVPVEPKPAAPTAVEPSPPPQETPAPEQETPAATLTVPTPTPAVDSSTSPSITLIVPPTPEDATPVADDAAPPPPTAAPVALPELSDPPAVVADAPPPPAPAPRARPVQTSPAPAPSARSFLQYDKAGPIVATRARADLALAEPRRAAAARRNSLPLLPPDPLPDAPSRPFGLSAAFSGSAGASPLVIFAIAVALLLLVPPWFARRLPIRAAVWREGTLPAPLPRPG